MSKDTEDGGSPPKKKMRLEDANDTEYDASCILLVRKLNFSTTKEILKFHFEKFGQIIHCVVTSEPKAKLPGHGFVVFKSSRMVHMALAGRPHFIDGEEIELDAVLPKDISEEKGVEEEPPVQDTLTQLQETAFTVTLSTSSRRQYSRENLLELAQLPGCQFKPKSYENFSISCPQMIPKAIRLRIREMCEGHSVNPEKSGHVDTKEMLIIRGLQIEPESIVEELEKKITYLERQNKLLAYSVLTAENVLRSCQSNLENRMIFVVDTNVVLHHLALINKLKDTIIDGFKTTLYFPYAVFAELDHLKMELQKEVHLKAEISIAYINQVLTFHGSFYGQSIFEQAASETCYSEISDDKVLEACLGLRQKVPQEKIFLLTNDVNLQIKAKLWNINLCSRKFLTKKLNPQSSFSYKDIKVEKKKLSGVLPGDPTEISTLDVSI